MLKVFRSIEKAKKFNQCEIEREKKLFEALLTSSKNLFLIEKLKRDIGNFSSAILHFFLERRKLFSMIFC